MKRRFEAAVERPVHDGTRHRALTTPGWRSTARRAGAGFVATALVAALLSALPSTTGAAAPARAFLHGAANAPRVLARASTLVVPPQGARRGDDLGGGRLEGRVVATGDVAGLPLRAEVNVASFATGALSSTLSAPGGRFSLSVGKPPLPGTTTATPSR